MIKAPTEWIGELIDSVERLAYLVDAEDMTLSYVTGVKDVGPERRVIDIPVVTEESGRVQYQTGEYNVAIAWVEDSVSVAISKAVVTRFVERFGSPVTKRRPQIVFTQTVRIGEPKFGEDPKVLAIELMVCGLGRARRAMGTTKLCDSCPSQLNCLGMTYD